MYPPRISDAEVRTVIREFTAGRQLPAGAAVRRVLAERFKCRGGVARIYRLLAEEGARLTAPLQLDSIEALRQELAAMRDRAQRAEDREEAHQTRWAEEIDRLRLKVHALEPLAHQARVARDEANLMRHQLQAAELRAATLEQELYRLAHQEGQASAPSPPGHPRTKSDCFRE